MPDIHIIPDGDRWNVNQENGGVVSCHDTQAEAENAGKGWLRDHGGGEVFTHATKASSRESARETP
jgi:hypothetical protein